MLSKITKNIYLAGSKDITQSALNGLPITAILNVASEVPDISILGVSNYRKGFEDSAESALAGANDAVRMLLYLIRKGETVLVHCKAGASRSPHVVASALANLYGYSYDEAYGYVRDLHPRAIEYSIGQEMREKGLI